MSSISVAFVSPFPLSARTTHISTFSPAHTPLRHVHTPHFHPAPIHHRVLRATPAASASSSNPDVIIIGSGFGGLSAAAMLTAHGLKPLILESHYAPGGTAHGFTVRNKVGIFQFDTGPSFFCGLTPSTSQNPLKTALDAVDQRVSCVAYDKFHIDDLRVGTIIVSRNTAETLSSVRTLAGPDAAAQLDRFQNEMRRIHAAMTVPSAALRGDWRLAPVLARRWAPDLLSLLPFVGDVKKPVSTFLRRVGVTDPLVQRLLDTEAFLLSGLKTGQTITAEIAFMVGERERPGGMEYPIGGARAIVDKLVNGIERKGGQLRLRAHVDEIIVRDGTAVGVRLRNGEEIFAKHVFSNASLWDTLRDLLPRDSLPPEYRATALETPVVESFMHVHLAIPSGGLPTDIIGHHAVIIDSNKDIAVPGNTVMFSMPTIWSPDLAPKGWHIIHAYTLEPYDGWVALKNNRAEYEAAKKEAAQPLFTAIRHVIPDLDERLKDANAIVKIGSPLTHARFNRRYKGTYGAAIDAGKSEFEWPNDIPINNLKRCSDSCFPGIGVPSSAAAGLIAANELVSVPQHNEVLDRLFP